MIGYGPRQAIAQLSSEHYIESVISTLLAGNLPASGHAGVGRVDGAGIVVAFLEH